MKLLIFISRLKFQFLDPEKREEAVRKSLLLSLITTEAFSAMSLQDKILSLARIISIFQNDFGFAPKRFEQLLLRLNRKLNHQIIKTFL